MLICRLEIWPERNQADAYCVGEVRIGQSAGDCFVADYKVEIDKASRQTRTPGIWRTADVRHFDRSRLGYYDLLLRALIACLGGRSHVAAHSITPSTSIFDDANQLETA